MNVDLMMKVRQKVLDEPNRVNMDLFKTQLKKWGIFPCGTACCIAGHAIELSGGRVWDCSSGAVGDAAGELLRLSERERNYLFHFHATKKRFNADSPYLDLGAKLRAFEPGSKEYAEIVVEAIDRCISLNQSTLEKESPTTDESFAQQCGITLKDETFSPLSTSHKIKLETGSK